MKVPDGGWNAATFARHGAALVREMARTARRTRVAGERALRLVLRDVFRGLAREIVRRATGPGAHFRRYEPVEVLVGVEAIPEWLAALDASMRDLTPEMVTQIIPTIQRVIAKAYAENARLLGIEQVPGVADNLLGRGPGLAQRITSITETTRERFRKVIREALDEGQTPGDLAETMYERFEDVSMGRIPTIARTEMGNAYNDGSVAAFQQSSAVTHVSVIGCLSRERERWGDPSWAQYMWRGESTCNITDVKVAECHLLRFHPNHSGAMVASRFKEIE